MKIRNAKIEELDTILEIIDNGRKFMRANGNTDQWTNGYPDRDTLRNDIDLGQLYIAEDSDNGEILAVFAYIPGIEPTYAVIDNGSWLNDDPYGTIHRIASTGKQRNITAKIFDWALNQCPNLRIDTHADNHVMQSACERYGFKMCGIIYLEDGAPRIAYHITK